MSTAMMTRPACLAARPVAKASAVRRPLRPTSQPRLRTLVRADPTKVPGAGERGRWRAKRGRMWIGSMPLWVEAGRRRVACSAGVARLCSRLRHGLGGAVRRAAPRARGAVSVAQAQDGAVLRGRPGRRLGQVLGCGSSARRRRKQDRACQGMEGVPGMVQEAGKSVCAHSFRVCWAQDSSTVETAIKEAQDTCADGSAGECAAAWDSVRAGSPSVRQRVDVVEHGLHRGQVLQG